MFKSTDGGNTWSPLITNRNLNGTFTALAIDPVAPSTLYTGTAGSSCFFGSCFGRVLKSTDGGTTWVAVEAGQIGAVYALVIDPRASSTLYAGTQHGRGAFESLFKSTAGGNTWSVMNSGLPSSFVRALAIDASAPSTLYAGTALGHVFKSTDGAASWNTTSAELTTAVTALEIDASALETLYELLERSQHRAAQYHRQRRGH